MTTHTPSSVAPGAPATRAELALATLGHADVPETLTVNEKLAPVLATGYSEDVAAMQAIRERSVLGSGESPGPDIRTVEIAGVPCRIVERERARGTYVHLHGGGWSFGSHLTQDDRLRRLARATGLRVVSVGYRLLPEHPWPAQAEDCLAVAREVIASSDDPVAMGGESAGAHLSVETAVRLRDEGARPLAGLVLTYGVFDLTLTPSVAREQAARTLPEGQMPALELLCRGMSFGERHESSPLRADLTGMPPARFLVGTRDSLLDDSLWMEARWRQVAPTEIDVVAAAVHAFTLHDCAVTRECERREHAFLRRVTGTVS